jgi:hypothetical protein
MLPLFCLSLANTKALDKGKKGKGVITSVEQPLVNDQRHMGIQIEGGDRPGNQGLSKFKVLQERQGLGPRISKPEEPNQQPTAPDPTLYERFHGERGRSRSGIAGGEAHNETYRRLQKYFESEKSINDKE